MTVADPVLCVLLTMGSTVSVSTGFTGLEYHSGEPDPAVHDVRMSKSPSASMSTAAIPHVDGTVATGRFTNTLPPPKFSIQATLPVALVHSMSSWPSAFTSSTATPPAHVAPGPTTASSLWANTQFTELLEDRASSPPDDAITTWRGLPREPKPNPVAPTTPVAMTRGVNTLAATARSHTTVPADCSTTQSSRPFPSMSLSCRSTITLTEEVYTTTDAHVALADDHDVTRMSVREGGTVTASDAPSPVTSPSRRMAAPEDCIMMTPPFQENSGVNGAATMDVELLSTTSTAPSPSTSAQATETVGNSAVAVNIMLVGSRVPLTYSES